MIASFAGANPSTCGVKTSSQPNIPQERWSHLEPFSTAREVKYTVASKENWFLYIFCVRVDVLGL